MPRDWLQRQVALRLLPGVHFWGVHTGGQIVTHGLGMAIGALPCIRRNIGTIFQEAQADNETAHARGLVAYALARTPLRQPIAAGACGPSSVSQLAGGRGRRAPSPSWRGRWQAPAAARCQCLRPMVGCVLGGWDRCHGTTFCPTCQPAMQAGSASRQPHTELRTPPPPSPSSATHHRCSRAQPW